MLPDGWRRAFRIDRAERRIARDVEREIAFHLELRTSALIATGMDPDTARAQALAQFGDLSAVRDECLTIDTHQERAMKWSETIGSVQQDVRYALRSLRKQPTFTLAVVLTLALGIGANTAMFSLIDALLLRTLPVQRPEQLVIIGDPSAVNSGWNGSPETRYVSYPLYADVRDHNTVLTGLAASGSANGLDVVVAREGAAVDLLTADHPSGRFVTGNFFSVLGVRAVIGRTFTADDDRVPLGDPVVVLSYSYWQRLFSSDRSAVGAKLSVNGVLLTVIGVTPPDFTGDIVGQTTDLWIPMMMQPAVRPQRMMIDNRSASWLQMMGRLAPGVSLARARTELVAVETRAIRAQLTGIHLARFDDDLKTSPVQVEEGARGFSSYRQTYAAALSVLMSAVALVVLVVCANVATLMLARSTARAREMSVRMTLGAGRSRLMQQLLTESVLLAVASGALGLVVSTWGSRLLLVIASDGRDAIPLDVAPNATVLAFTAGVTLLTVVLFGLLPALRATRVDLSSALRAQGRSVIGVGGRIARMPVGKSLVVAQVALSTLLLVGAGLLVRSMQRIAGADLGLDRDHLIIAEVSAGKRGYTGERLNALMRDAVERVERIPGVVAASYSFEGVFTGGESSDHVSIPGFVARADSQLAVHNDEVGPGYFRAVGGRILRGRDFDARDMAANVAMINETMMRYYFPGADPVGRTLSVDTTTFTITGVVRDMQEADVRAKPVRRFYYPARLRTNPHGFVMEIRVAGDPSRLVAPIRDALLAADRTLPLDISTLGDLVRASISEDVLVTKVTAFFGLVTLVLAALGLYGVTAYGTAQRTSELGLRVALGAEPARVAGTIVAEALGLALVGVAIGLPVGLAATRLIRDQIFGVGAVDPPSLSVAVGVLVGAALLASYLPARRASRVDPLEALRAE